MSAETGVTGPGHVVAGRYRLTRRIGGGGMGAVWLAHDERLGRDVAVKQIVLPMTVTLQEAEEHRQLAMREGRIAARLHHPHAIAVYDAALDGGTPWLVMEHLHSRSLAEVIAQDGVLPVDQAAQVGAQVADALSAAHAAGITHRDVKPANILIGRSPGEPGLVKITDFGIARARGDVRLTQTGIVKGTPAFMAPEVARGSEPGPAGDVFSLGATLFASLEGQPPFGISDNSLQQLYRVAAGEIDQPQHCGALTRPLLGMLARDPEQRPTMRQVRDQLALLATPGGGDVTAVLSRPALLAPQPRPRRTAVVPAGEPEQRSPTRTGAAVPAFPDVARPPEPLPAARSSRRTPVLLALAVVLVLLVGGLTYLLNRGGDGGPAPTADASTSASTSTEPPAPVVQPTTSAPVTTTAAPTTTPSPEAPAPVRKQDVQRALQDYYSLLPEDPEQAYALTGPTLQSLVSAQQYAAFFGRFREVQLGRVEAADGSLVADAQLTFVQEDGTRMREQHTVTLVQDGDQLLVDSDVFVSSED